MLHLVLKVECFLGGGSCESRIWQERSPLRIPVMKWLQVEAASSPTVAALLRGQGRGSGYLGSPM